MTIWDRQNTSQYSNTIGRTLLAGIFLLIPVAAANAGTCGRDFGLDFGPPALGSRESNHIVPALLRIENGDDDTVGYGTAFLVDNEHGLYLTAGHVVRSVIVDSDTTVGGRKLIGRNPRIANGPLPLKLIARLLEENSNQSLYRYREDIAVLQLLDPAPVRHIAPLELAFQRPRRGVGLKLYGYGLSSGSDLYPQPSSEPRSFDPNSPAPLYKFPTEIHGGDSGAPVYDETGVVYGLTLGNISTGWGLFHSLDQYVNFLFELKPPPRDERIRTTTFGPDEVGTRQEALTRLLDADPNPDGITNFELARFIVDMVTENKLVEIPAELVACPLYYASQERPLGLKSAPLLELQYRYETKALSPNEATRHALKKAKTLEQQGSLIAANAAYRVAREAADVQVAGLLSIPSGQKAIIASFGRAEETDSAAPLELAGDIQPGNFPEMVLYSNKIFSKIVEGLNLTNTTAPLAVAGAEQPMSLTSYGSNSLSVALHDYSLAVSGLARTADALGTPLTTTEEEATALRAATLSAAVAYSPQWKYRALDTLAVKAIAVGNPELASRAYAEIWASGDKNATVRSNFDTSIAKVTTSDDQNKSAKSANIEKYKGLDAADLLRFSTGNTSMLTGSAVMR